MSVGNLTPLYTEIRNGNNIAYRKSLTRLIRKILNELRMTIVSMESLPKKNVLMSYHASSVILRGWIRVTHSRKVWKRTTFAQTEIDTFRKIYDWDARPGHLMTDPHGPSDIDVVFCRENSLKGEPCITPKAWRISRTLLHSVFFPVLVEHDLDHVGSDDFDLASKCVKASRRIKISKAEFNLLSALARSLEKSGIWTKDEFQAMPVLFQVRSFLVTFFYTIGRCAVPDASAKSQLFVEDGANFERVVAYGAHPEAIGLVPGNSDKTGSLALVTSHEDKASLLYDVKDGIREACKLLAKSLRGFELDAAATTTCVRTTWPDEEDRIRLACEVDWENDPNHPTNIHIVTKRLTMLTSPLHDELAEMVPRCGFVTPSLLHKLKDAVKNVKLANHSSEIANLLTNGVFMNGDITELEAIASAKSVALKKLLPEVTKEINEWQEKCDNTYEALTNQFDMVGASRLYIDLLKRLRAAVAQCGEDEPQVIFLHSEPGCGKENIAKLIHLVSDHSCARRVVHQFSNVLPMAPKEDWELFKVIVDSRACQNDPDIKLKDMFEEKPGHRKPMSLAKKWGQTRLFNYFSLNMATLHSHDNFTHGLFGKYKKEPAESIVGRCLLAHLFGGTVFLDEINTLPEPKWANCFLRLFEKPYEMDIPGRAAGPIVKSNLLMICASNLNGEELIRRGFNEAIVYRLTRRSFTIPPLRDRRVDIAVFVNSILRRRNSGIAKPNERIRKVNSNAMELLCELPWPDNYRGLQALLSEIFEARQRSGMTEQELRFKEIVDGLRRRETLLAVIRRAPDDPGSVTLKLKI